MGKMLRKDSPYEQKVQQIEALMNKLGVTVNPVGIGGSTNGK